MDSQLLKIFAIFCIASTILSNQADCAAIGQMETVFYRVRRMTPLWRWTIQKPVGSTCRNNDDCITKYCRNSRCSVIAHRD
ncbi:liver-expressed antimicrobial peptide 2-like [Hypanus sabinus]|uniref:liver-expressed antimicrobial peptide 2-like n=1 Tax=Hypanus sabinus TaxID=79690 RepID=UPI0028C3D864|nr:liver-expressed antimicrobial peptide 2-like [Hypanus sabinus]